MTERQPVTAVVLTLDEESLVGRCVGALAWADEVLVVDSGSTDATRELAAAAGARVVEQPWLGWSAQRNAGAAAASNDWVVFLEADEVMTATLAAAVGEVLAGGPDPADAWSMDRRDELMGELMPSAQRRSKTADRVRLYHRGHSRWDESMLVHEEVLVTGAKHLLPGHLVHWRPQGVAEVGQVVARYAAIEARDRAAHSRRASAARLVALPLARFAWLYAVRGSCRHGVPGLVNAVLRAHADFLRLAQQIQDQGPPAPADPPARLVDR